MNLLDEISIVFTVTSNRVYILNTNSFKEKVVLYYNRLGDFGIKIENLIDKS